MCGIAGIIYSTENDRSQAIACAGNALRAMQHRGPDHQSIFHDNRCVLAHARLKIIDTSDRANQPMEDHSGQYVLVFNGEIFNYQELRNRPSIRHVEFLTTSDTEVLLYLLIHEGEQVLSALNGFFAFAFYHRPTGNTLLARDRFGVKPLWYSSAPGFIAFASELRALMSFPIGRTIDRTSLSYLLTHTYIPGPYTAIEEARKLLPGQVIRISEGTVEVRTWYTPPSITSQEDPQQLTALLSDAVRIRLIADVPVGVFLSGGIDSAIVTALAAKHTRQLNTYSVAFPDHPYLDESREASEVADFVGARHTTIPFEERVALEAVQQALTAMDEPFADSSAIAFHLLCRGAKSSVTVALGGDGADEVFGGYRKHIALWSREKRPLLNSVIGLFSPLLPEVHSRGSFWTDNLRKLKRYAGLMGMSDDEAIWYLAQFHSRTDIDPLLTNPHESEYVARKQVFLRGISGGLSDALLFDQRFVLPNDMLVKVDTMSMGASLEVRSPFLDYRVVEFANRLKPEDKISDGVGKQVLRKEFREILPPTVFHRRKKGFEIPLDAWFRGPLKQFALDTLSPSSVPHGLFNSRELERWRKSIHSGDAVPASLIWSALTFQVWYNRTIGM